MLSSHPGLKTLGAGTCHLAIPAAFLGGLAQSGGAVPEIAGNLGSGFLATGDECGCNFPFLQQMPNLPKNVQVHNVPSETVHADTPIHTYTHLYACICVSKYTYKHIRYYNELQEPFYTCRQET